MRGLVWSTPVALFKFGCKNLEFFFYNWAKKKKVSVTLLRRKMNGEHMSQSIYILFDPCPNHIVFHYLTLMYNYKAEKIANMCLRFVNWILNEHAK